MRTIAIIVFLILPGLVFAQDVRSRKQIDSSVLVIDKGTGQMSFFETGRDAKRTLWKVRYQFKRGDGDIGKIVRQYRDGDSSVAQVFYMISSSLIFSTESIVSYYGSDSIEWQAKYYFSDGELADFETLGHGKSEIGTWNPENEVFRNYQRAKSAVRDYLRIQKSGQSRRPRK